MKMIMRLTLAAFVVSTEASFLANVQPVNSTLTLSVPQVPQAAVAIGSIAVHQGPKENRAAATAAMKSAAEAQHHLEKAMKAFNTTKANVKEITRTGKKIEATAGDIKTLYKAPLVPDAKKKKAKPVDQSSPDKLKDKDSPLWHLLITWAVLIVVTFVARRNIITHRSYTPAQRAPYAAFLIILWFITVFATIFFALSDHAWTWIECVYFCVVTVTTVGYGDYVPHDSTLDKLMLLAFLWLNMMVLSVVLGIVTGAADEEAEGSKGKGLKWHVMGIIGLTLGGAVMMMGLEGWSFLQGFTFATVTLTTVGYGALLPSSPTSMICASIFILIGVPCTGCLVGSVGGMIDDKFSKRKASMSKGSLIGTYVAIIIGWLLLGAQAFHTFNGHGWDWPQCLYLAAVTMTTVGYGDYVPEKTFTDHIVTIVYIWGSVIVIAAVFSDLDGLLLDSITAGMKRQKAMITRVMMLAAIIVTGVVAFDFLEGWSILHGLVYTSVTCTTVGYGHLLPSTAAARLFAVPFLLAAVPMTGCLVSSVSSQYSDEISTLIADVD